MKADFLKKLFILSLGLLILFPSSVIAIDRAGNISLSLSGGWFSSEQGSDSFFGRSSIGLSLSNYLSFDLSLLNAFSRNGSTFLSIDSSLNLFPEAKISPLIVLGAGAGIIERGDGTSTKGLINAGAGLQYFLGDETAIRFDLRSYILSGQTDWAISAGIVFYFDPEYKPLPSAPEKEQAAKPVSSRDKLIMVKARQEAAAPEDKTGAVTSEGRETAQEVAREKEERIQIPGTEVVQEQVVSAEPEKGIGGVADLKMQELKEQTSLAGKEGKAPLTVAAAGGEEKAGEKKAEAEVVRKGSEKFNGGTVAVKEEAPGKDEERTERTENVEIPKKEVPQQGIGQINKSEGFEAGARSSEVVSSASEEQKGKIEVSAVVEKERQEAGIEEKTAEQKLTVTKESVAEVKTPEIERKEKITGIAEREQKASARQPVNKEGPYSVAAIPSQSIERTKKGIPDAGRKESGKEVVPGKESALEGVEGKETVRIKEEGSPRVDELKKAEKTETPQVSVKEVPYQKERPEELIEVKVPEAGQKERLPEKAIEKPETSHMIAKQETEVSPERATNQVVSGQKGPSVEIKQEKPPLAEKKEVSGKKVPKKTIKQKERSSELIVRKKGSVKEEREFRKKHRVYERARLYGEGQTPESPEAESSEGATGPVVERKEPESGAAEPIILKKNSLEATMEFALGETTLSSDNQNVLLRFVDKLREKKKYRKIVIEGHACAHGSREMNLRISKKRALAAKRFLQEHGIKRNIIIRFYGEERLKFKEIPTPDNINDPHVRANRRVTVTASW